MLNWLLKIMQKMKLYAIWLISAFVGFISALSVSYGPCLSTPKIDDFSLKKFAGTWYEIKRFHSWVESGFSSVRLEYNYVDHQTCSVRNYAINPSNHQIMIEGELRVRDLNKPNAMVEKNPMCKIMNKTICSKHNDYNVWLTDYKNFAVVYSCQRIIPYFLRVDMVWIFGREKTLDSGTLAMLDDYIKSKGIDVTQFEMVDQQSEIQCH